MEKERMVTKRKISEQFRMLVVVYILDSRLEEWGQSEQKRKTPLTGREGDLRKGLWAEERRGSPEAELRWCWIEQWGQGGTRFTQSPTLQTELCRDPSLTVAFPLYLDVARRDSDFLKDGRQTVSPSHVAQCGLTRPMGRLHPQQARLSQLPEAARGAASLGRSRGTWSKVSARCWEGRPLTADALCLCKRGGHRTGRWPYGARREEKPA